jgi:hypothetical protein
VGAPRYREARPGFWTRRTALPEPSARAKGADLTGDFQRDHGRNRQGTEIKGDLHGEKVEESVDRKGMVRKYKETPRPAGVFRVQHKPSGRTLLGASPDAPAMLNRIRAQLKMKGHPNRSLQRDWDADGPDAFLFEVLDLLPPSQTAERDSSADLATLEELWTEKLELRKELRY